MTVTEKFKNDSAMAAIRALRGLEPTSIMLEKYAPDVFPEVVIVNGVEQKHFGRLMMESAAQAIRDAWVQAIKEAENSDRADMVAEVAALIKAVQSLLNGIDTGLLTLDTAADETLANTMSGLRVAVAALAWTQEEADHSAPAQSQESGF